MQRGQLEKLDTKALTEKLSEFGYSVSGNVSKDGLIEQLLHIEEAKINNSNSTNKKALSDYKRIWNWNKKHNKNLKDEPVLTVTFHHMDGDKEVQFTYGGPIGTVVDGEVFKMPTQEGEDGKKRWSMKLPKWHLLQGRQYQVPLSLYNHINSRVVKDLETIGESEAGTPITREVIRKRLSVEHIPDEKFLNNKEPAHAKP